MKEIEELQMEGFRGAPHDWEKGPSALDKAVHLFFFTEIIRGVYSHVNAKGKSWMTWNRNVDCSRELLPSPIHHHVSFREGPAVTPLPR